MISAVVMTGPFRPLEMRSFGRPELEPGAVLLRTLGSEVCGTDTHLWRGQLAGVPYPIIPGHVSVGQIAALGPAAAPNPLPNRTPGTQKARPSSRPGLLTCGFIGEVFTFGADLRGCGLLSVRPTG